MQEITKKPFRDFTLVQSSDKVLELMRNGYYLKHFKGDAADYWTIMNDVMDDTPYVVPVDDKFVPHDRIEVAKSVELKGWFFPGNPPIVTTYRIKEDD